jgi:hypothetical protein
MMEGMSTTANMNREETRQQGKDLNEPIITCLDCQWIEGGDEIRCSKGHWTLNMDSRPFNWRTCMLSARECSDFDSKYDEFGKLLPEFSAETVELSNLSASR